MYRMKSGEKTDAEISKHFILKMSKKLFWKCLNVSFKNLLSRWNISAFLNPNTSYLAGLTQASFYQI